MISLSTVLFLLVSAAVPPVVHCGFFNIQHLKKHEAHFQPPADIASFPDRFVEGWPGNEAMPDRDEVHTSDPGPGEPLFLSPYIKKKEYEKARELSKFELGGFSGYAGFITVSEATSSYLYFWFFPAISGNTSAPLLLWLQGGPGESSLFGAFDENGPFSVDKDGLLRSREATWNRNYHMLYIDNPTGTGFSFTKTTGGFSHSAMDIALKLYTFLLQFFTLYSGYQECDFYVFGESYAGKYVPTLGYWIDKMNHDTTPPEVYINLKGVAIGDGLVDPVNMVPGYADLLFQYGLADENQAAYVKSQTELALKYIQEEEYSLAAEIFDELFAGLLYPYPTYFYNITGMTNYDNILRQDVPEVYDYYIPYINRADMRRTIHVGNLSFGGQTLEVVAALINDSFKSVAKYLTVLLDKDYKVLIYNGQLDIIIAPPLTERYLQVC